MIYLVNCYIKAQARPNLKEADRLKTAPVARRLCFVHLTPALEGTGEHRDWTESSPRQLDISTIDLRHFTVKYKP